MPYSLRHDPIDDDPAYQDLLGAVEAEIHADLAARGYAGQMGYCHLFWMEKQRVLLWDHGVDWKSPQELNPGVLFD